MFTGIVEESGSVESFARGASSWRLRVRAARVLEGTAQGDSVAVNGCCLTAVGLDGGAITFDVLEETRRLTNFRSLAPGAPVNLERSMRTDGRLGGHFVTGHIDGTGLIEAFGPRGADHWLRVRGPSGCGRLLIHKGSIAVDGISLTVAEVDGDAFAVWIIPHTVEVTNLRASRAGDAVNLEFDMIGKYVEKLLESRRGEA
ncbi:MAG: riboflavin synthase [Opitutaceae bacterium]|jgi:riboflavin synthase